MATITRLEVQKRNKERVNVYLDDAYQFSIPILEAARLHKGQQLSEDDITLLRERDTLQRAIDQAARFLSYRPRSIREVRRNLKDKEFTEDVIEGAIAHMEKMGYLDDAAFARFWLDNRNTFQPKGPMALRYELRQKGIAEDIIEIVLEDVDVEDAAYRAAQKKARSLRGKDLETFRNKLGSFLQRRGFSYGISRDVIEQLASDLTTETPDFFIEADEA